MKLVPYSALDKNQIAQIAYLFADEHFGTHADEFDYLVEGGRVMGRRADDGRQTMDDGRRTKKQGRVLVSVEMDAQARDQYIMSADALVEILTKNIEQLEEVHHEK